MFTFILRPTPISVTVQGVFQYEIIPGVFRSVIVNVNSYTSEDWLKSTNGRDISKRAITDVNSIVSGRNFDILTSIIAQLLMSWSFGSLTCAQGANLIINHSKDSLFC